MNNRIYIEGAPYVIPPTTLEALKAAGQYTLTKPGEVDYAAQCRALNKGMRRLQRKLAAAIESRAAWMEKAKQFQARLPQEYDSGYHDALRATVDREHGELAVKNDAIKKLRAELNLLQMKQEAR